MKAEAVIEKLAKNIEAKKEEYNNRLGQKEKLEAEQEKKEEALAACKEERELLEQVNIFLQEVSQYARKQAKQQIELLVTQALQAVFGEKIRFEIEIEKKRNSFSAQFYVVSEYEEREIKNVPQNARGGGVVDVVSLGLRVAMLETLQRPNVGGPLVLDEPAKHVSEEYIFSVTEFLRMVNDRFDRQIVIVTHQQELAQFADKGFKVTMKKGNSKVSTLTESN